MIRRINPKQVVAGALRVWKRKRQRKAELGALKPVAGPLGRQSVAEALRALEAEACRANLREVGVDCDQLCEALGWMERGPQVTLVRPHNLRGFVTHYHHFFGAVIMPILEWRSVGALTEGARVVVRDCGPMNRELLQWAEIAGFEVRVVPHLLIDAIVASGLPRVWDATGHDYTYREDWYPRNEVIDPIRSFVFSRLGLAPSALEPRTGRPKVILIGRDRPDPFYKTKRAERGTSGTERRSIPNMDALADVLAGGSAQVSVVLLEKMQVAEKIRLFSEADIAVGQMGAGLNNVVWMRKGSGMIEICPVETLHDNFAVFSSICHRIGVEHRRIIQASSHAPVPPELVAGFVRAMFPGSPVG